jgi:hypothetical protein
MQSSIMNRSERYLLPRQVLTMNELNALWRIESGTVRINSVDESDESKINFVRLALPGDLLGVECFSGVEKTLQVRAITPVKLQPVDVADDKAMTALLMKTICYQPYSLPSGCQSENRYGGRTCQTLAAYAEARCQSGIQRICLGYVAEFGEYGGDCAFNPRNSLPGSDQLTRGEFSE